MKKIKFIALAICVTTILVSCSGDPVPTPVQEDIAEGYLLSMATAGSEVVHYLPNIESGTADVLTGQDMPAAFANKIGFGKKGFYYVMNDALSKFTKFASNGSGGLTEQASITVSTLPLTTGIGGYCWYDNSSVLIWAYDKNVAGVPITYALINVDGSMRILSQGSLGIPYLSTANHQTVDFAVKSGTKLFMGYHESAVGSLIDATPFKVAVFDAASVGYIKTISDQRSELSGNGSINMANVAENGDVYISPEPRVNGVVPNPTGVYKIKYGETDFDTTYYFETRTVCDGQDVRGFQYIGEGKALASTWNKTLGSTPTDFLSGQVKQYYMLDLIAKTATKINVPDSASPYPDFTKTKSGNWAFPVNTTSGNALYIYNPVTGTATKGLTYTGALSIKSAHRIQ